MCRKADSPSMSTSIANVKNAQTANTTYNLIEASNEVPMPIRNTRCQSTADNSGKKQNYHVLFIYINIQVKRGEIYYLINNIIIYIKNYHATVHFTLMMKFPKTFSQ